MDVSTIELRASDRTELINGVTSPIDERSRREVEGFVCLNAKGAKYKGRLLSFVLVSRADILSRSTDLASGTDIMGADKILRRMDLSTLLIIKPTRPHVIERCH